MSNTVRRAVRVVALVMWQVGAYAASAHAQANVGSGPMTGSLPDTEPTTGVINIYRLRVAPGITIRELGWDGNVFDTATDPKEDYVASVQPDAAGFLRLRFVRLSGYIAGDYRYQRTYTQERSAGMQTRGRADFLLSRIRPFVAGGYSKSRSRPNGEIDVRANILQREASGGIAFDVSRYGQFYAAAYEFKTQFNDAFEDGIDIALALNRKSNEYSAGLRTEVTPLLAMTLSGAYTEDTFKASPRRNANMSSANVGFRIGAEALINGFISLSYRDLRPADPNLIAFRGLTGSLALAYPFMEVGRFNLMAGRQNEYSFEEADGFYIMNNVGLSYNHRLFGKVDAQVQGSFSAFDYGYSARVPAHTDTLTSMTSGVGYNLRNRTRIAVNYEYAERKAPQIPERNYIRRKVFLNWSFAY